MSNWRNITLGDIAEIQTGPFGSQLHASDYVFNGIPSIMPKNIGDNRIIEDEIARISMDDAQRLSKYRVKKGDIIYSRRGDVEKRALIKDQEEGWLCGTGCLRIRFGKNIVDPSYATYYLGHPQVRAWIVQHAHGATMPNLNTEILSATPFILPPFTIQQKIAAILSSLDDKIENNRKTCEKLEEIAQAIFKRWFVDFESPNEEGLPYKSSDGEMVYSEELGKEIPKGWSINTLGMYVDVKGGKRLPSGHSLVDKETEHPYIRVTDVDNGFIDRANIKFIEDSTWEHIKRYKITVDDVFISIAGTIGLVGIVDNDLNNANLTENMAKLCNIDDEVISQYFILLYLISEYGQNQIASRTVGSTQPKLALFRIKDIQFIMPSREVMTLFHRTIKSLYLKILNFRSESYIIAQIRDALLPKLMSGELAVEEGGLGLYEN